MKLSVMAAAGLAVGIVGGALTSGLGVKAEIMEARAQAEADSLAALDRAEGVEGHEGVTVELPAEAPDEAHGAAVDPAPNPVDLPPDATTPRDPEHLQAPSEGGAGGAIEDITGVANPAALPAAGQEGGAPDGGAVQAPTQAGPPTPGAVNDEGSRKLAKIFGAMDPEDAAAVLQEMTDEEVTAILVKMSDRLAAPLIAAFPPERAAVLTQAVLRAGGSGA